MTKRVSYPRGFLIVCFLTVCSPALGQEGEPSKPESPWWRQVPVTGRQENKSPFWAGVSSLVLPGGGQFYTGNELRGLLFFFSQGTLLGMTLHEHIRTEDSWRRYKRTGNSKDYEDYCDHFERRYDLLWWDVGIWFLGVADACVDAHMYDFKKGGRVAFLIESNEQRGLELRLSLGF